MDDIKGGKEPRMLSPCQSGTRQLVPPITEELQELLSFSVLTSCVNVCIIVHVGVNTNARLTAEFGLGIRLPE